MKYFLFLELERVSFFLERFNYYKWIRDKRLTWALRNFGQEREEDYILNNADEALEFIEAPFSMSDLRRLLNEQELYFSKAHLMLLERVLGFIEYCEEEEYLWEEGTIKFKWTYNNMYDLNALEDDARWILRVRELLFNPPCYCCYYFHFYQITRKMKVRYPTLWNFVINEEIEQDMNRTNEPVKPLCNFDEIPLLFPD